MRQQLPPGIKKLELNRRKDGKPIVRYEILTEVTKVNGQRKRIRTRKNVHGEPLATEVMARAELARLQNDVATGAFVHHNRTTVEQACEAWLKSKHGLKPSTRRGYEVWLAPLRQELGHVELQRLTKNDLDRLIRRLKAGDVPKHGKWTPRSINGMVGRFYKVMDDARKQGHVQRNVVELIDRLPQEKADLNILSEAQMFMILDYPDRDRHIWALALYGLRRGELTALRWENVDFEKRTIAVVESFASVGKEDHLGTPKSKASRRVLPMPDEVYEILLDAKQRIESAWVCSDERGNRLRGSALTYRWKTLLGRLGIGYVRLHDARVTSRGVV